MLYRRLSLVARPWQQPSLNLSNCTTQDHWLGATVTEIATVSQCQSFIWDSRKSCSVFRAQNEVQSLTTGVSKHVPREPLSYSLASILIKHTWSSESRLSDSSRQECWSWLELKSAGLWPSRSRIGHLWLIVTCVNNLQCTIGYSSGSQTCSGDPQPPHILYVSLIGHTHLNSCRLYRECEVDVTPCRVLGNCFVHPPFWEDRAAVLLLSSRAVFWFYVMIVENVTTVCHSFCIENLHRENNYNHRSERKLDNSVCFFAFSLCKNTKGSRLRW